MVLTMASKIKSNKEVKVFYNEMFKVLKESIEEDSKLMDWYN